MQFSADRLGFPLRSIHWRDPVSSAERKALLRSSIGYRQHKDQFGSHKGDQYPVVLVNPGPLNSVVSLLGDDIKLYTGVNTE